MSWKASAWAKEQRLGSPSAKSILMCLADYADPEGIIKGWASQSDLSASAEVSERTAREWLQRLEDWGLVERQRQQRPNGARAADWIVLRLDRMITDGSERCKALKSGEAEEGLPAESAGRTYRQPDADPTGNQAHPTGNQFRAYKDNPPIEPPFPSQQERAEAREREDSEDRKKIEAAYWRMVRVWPQLQGLPKDTGLKAFLALSGEEREAAERRFPAWVEAIRAQGWRNVPVPSTYFGKRLFADIADPAEAPPAPAVGRPFGKLWGAMRLAELLQPPAPLPRASRFLEALMAEDSERGERERLAHRSRNGWPAVNDIHNAAANRRGITLPTEKAWLEPIASGFEPVRVGSDLWREWEAEHLRRGWPWVPDPGRQEWVYFPAGGPAGLVEFETTIRSEAKDHDGGGREAAE